MIHRSVRTVEGDEVFYRTERRFFLVEANGYDEDRHTVVQATNDNAVYLIRLAVELGDEDEDQDRRWWVFDTMVPKGQPPYRVASSGPDGEAPALSRGGRVVTYPYSV